MNRPVLAVVTACVLWGLAFLFAKVALAEMGFAHLVLYRFALACLFLGAFVVWRGARPRREHLPGLLATGFLCVPASMLLQFAGLERTSVTSASLIIGAAPPIIALAAHVWFGERLGRVGWLAVGLSSVGVALMVGVPTGGGDPIGDAMVLGSIVLAAAWILMSRPYARTYGAAPATAFILIAGTVPLVPIVVLWHGVPTVDLSAGSWASVFALAAFCTVAAFILWNWGVDRMAAGRAGVFINLEPVVGAASGILILGDALTAGMAAGGLVVLLAAWIVTRPRAACGEITYT